jgi:hypothetical protein
MGRFPDESASFAPYFSQLEFLYRGHVVWTGRTGGFNIHHGLSFKTIRKDESFAEYVQRSNHAPYHHFDSPRFPDFVPVPTRKRELRGKITSELTLGVTEVTAKGLRETALTGRRER